MQFTENISFIIQWSKWIVYFMTQVAVRIQKREFPDMRVQMSWKITFPPKHVQMASLTLQPNHAETTLTHQFNHWDYQFSTVTHASLFQFLFVYSFLWEIAFAGPLSSWMVLRWSNRSGDGFFGLIQYMPSVTMTYIKTIYSLHNMALFIQEFRAHMLKCCRACFVKCLAMQTARYLAPWVVIMTAWGAAGDVKAVGLATFDLQWRCGPYIRTDLHVCVCACDCFVQFLFANVFYVYLSNKRFLVLIQIHDLFSTFHTHTLQRPPYLRKYKDA